MTKRSFSILSLLLSVFLIFSSAFSASAAQTQEENYLTNITVRASEIKEKGAFKAIQAALNAAHFSATKDNPYKVTVEPGKYEIRTGLHVYSNTTLSLYNVTLYRNSEATCNIIRAGADTMINKGDSGYDANTNIKIEGGTLDGNATSNTMVKIAHATNFSMSGTVLQNLKNAHMMEIAGVDGFAIQNCSFKDQVLDVDGIGYEAIQLDILKEGHIVGCRSEAIPMKNVRIEGCYFDNVPRAIGTHTAILNCPFDGIVIRNNIFKNITSAAIQAQNWINCDISYNTIDSAPRAVTIYSVFEEGLGCYKAGILAREGNTSTNISEKYEKPQKANIVISDNTIKNCGTVKDIYAEYAPGAISLIGAELKKDGKLRSDDGSGVIPRGDYYIDGVMVKNNAITTAGNGVYLNNVNCTAISGNVIKCVKADYYDKKFNPISAAYSDVKKISGNTILSSLYDGMELSYSTAGTISSNSISGISGSAILLNGQSSVTGSISDNCISKVNYAVALGGKCSVKSIAENIFDSCSKGAVYKAKKASASVGANYDKILPMTKLTLSQSSLVLGTGEKCSISLSYEPKNSIAKFTWTSSDNGVATVSNKGVVTAQGIGSAKITVKSYSGKTASCDVKVMPAPDSIQLSENMLTIGLGEQVNLKSTIPRGTVARSIKYTSNNSSVAGVTSGGGVLTGLNLGTATVVASTYNGKRANCNVIVKYAPYDIWFNKRGLNLGIGESYQLSLILPDGSASHSIKYASSNEKALRVTQDGLISAVAEGEAVVTATAFNGAVAICNVKVCRVPETVAFEQEEYSTIVGEELIPNVVLPNGTASNDLSFQSSDPDICRVDKKTGLLTPKEKGTVTITVKTYNHLIATCRVAVN